MVKRYYVVNSSYFDTHPYNKPRIRRAVATGGGTNIRESNYHGWSNQPAVITFSAVSPKRVQDAVNKALKTQWVRVDEKFW